MKAEVSNGGTAQLHRYCTPPIPNARPLVRFSANFSIFAERAILD